MTGQRLASGHLLALLVLVEGFIGVCGDRSYFFSYIHNGEDWLEGECASRDRQSPIDFGKEAPWDCNPPVQKFLHQFLSPKWYRKLKFHKLFGDDDAEEDATAGAAPGPAPGAANAPAPAPSLLQLSQNASQIPAPRVGAPYVPPPPPPAPFFVAGCGNIGAFFFKYDAVEKPMTIQNNGHTISTDLKGHGLGSITWDGFIFDVLSVNFHVHSEHTFKGETMPLELHIVHREPETDHVLVVAIPFQEFPSASSLLQRKRRGRRSSLRGPPLQEEEDVENAESIASVTHMSDKEENQIMPTSNHGPTEPKPSDPGFSDALANLITYPLPEDGQIRSVPLRHGPVDLLTPLIGGATKMPEAYFQYRGSLTAPPCSEQVTWLVRKEPLYAARTQIELLRVAIMQANSNHENARSTMPLMGRHVLYMLALNGDPQPPPEQPPTPGQGPAQRAPADFRGVAMAKEAMFKALEAERDQSVITGAVAAAQQLRDAAGVGVDPAVAAGAQAQVAAGDMMYTTPIPTPNPEIQLSRIVDAVAAQMDGAEKAAAMAAAGVAAPR